MAKHPVTGSRTATLLSFSLGGVQPFIESARSTRDTWNGSFLLSYLSWTATSAMLDECARKAPRSNRADTCVLPLLSRQPFERARTEDGVDLTVAGFPNSVLLHLPADVDADAVRLAGRSAIESTWRDLVAACRRALTLDKFAVRMWATQTQLDAVFDIYWSALPVPDSAQGLNQLRRDYSLPQGSDFQALFESASQAFEARKENRTLVQVGEEGFRCSLCGERAALAPYAVNPRAGRPVASYEALVKFWDRQAVSDRTRHAFRDGERLCAVCTCRRLAPHEYLKHAVRDAFPLALFSPDFPSTATVSAAEALASGLLATDTFAPDVWFTPFNALVREMGLLVGSSFGIPQVMAAASGAGVKEIPDGTWFYLDEWRNGQTRGEIAPAAVERAAALLKRNPARPGGYIAALMVDGDLVGTHLKSLRSRQEVDAFGEQLANFRIAAEHLVHTSFSGRVVFAGGDDLLLFMPARRVLELCAEIHSLAATFLGAVTVSIGCCLAPYGEPLRETLRAARASLVVAKRSFGRNAFAVYRTTDGRTIGGRRDMLGPALELLELMRAPADGEPGLSPSVIGHLAELAPGVAGVEPLESRSFAADRARLIRMAADRASSDTARRSVDSAIVKLHARTRRWCRPDDTPGRERVGRDAFLSVVDMLGLIRFLSRQTR